MTVWAYARVSTRDQNPQLQLDALAASGYDELVTEKESGKRGVARPAWETLLALPQAGATLKFWKFASASPLQHPGPQAGVEAPGGAAVVAGRRDQGRRDDPVSGGAPGGR
ncbi:recombinase family protein [[Actinomadura] parvosata]|uniref:recombinase family protein n=1 Tax=[Actinomadura] parvosata TaxID=1955412 RepID=UPI00406C396F